MSTTELDVELEALGFAPYQARLLNALLRVGSGNSSTLAEEAGVPRTSVYKSMEILVARGVAELASTRGPSVWTNPGWEATLDALDLGARQKLIDYRSRTARLRQALDVADG